MSLTHVDLCTGLGGWKAPFEESPRWRSVGIDIRDDLDADVIGDVRSLPLDCRPDLLTASPPCTEFSRWHMPWLPDSEPSMQLVEASLNAVQELRPTWWVLENVVGLHRYWKPARKRVGPYYLWGEFPLFDAVVTDGGKMKISGMKPEERARIPYALADALRRAVETFTIRDNEVNRATSGGEASDAERRDARLFDALEELVATGELRLEEFTNGWRGYVKRGDVYYWVDTRESDRWPSELRVTLRGVINGIERAIEEGWSP